MAYFEPSIDAEGVHIPTYAELMEHLTGEYKKVFGNDVYLSPETKDYQLLSIFAKCMDDYAALVVDSYNSRNPNYAEGDALDLLLPLVSMQRRQATCSTVTLTLTGMAGTVIPEGKSAIDPNGVLWNLDSGVTLDSAGKATVGATCSVAGAITAPVGTITGIYTPVVGWYDVTNEEEAKVGRNTETDDEVRIRRRKSINLQNNGTFDAIIRALNSLEVDGEILKSINVIVNDTSVTDANGLPGHSICCVVDGIPEGDKEIAEAIWKAKAPGIGTYGTSSHTYTDDFGNQNTVYFERPVTRAVTVQVTLHPLDAFDPDRIVPIIQNEIYEEINGLGIGNAWSVTTAYRDIYNAFAGERCPFVIASIKGKTGPMQTYSTTEVPCAFNEILTLNVNDVVIEIPD